MTGPVFGLERHGPAGGVPIRVARPRHQAAGRRHGAETKAHEYATERTNMPPRATNLPRAKERRKEKGRVQHPALPFEPVHDPAFAGMTPLCWSEADAEAAHHLVPVNAVLIVGIAIFRPKIGV